MHRRLRPGRVPLGLPPRPRRPRGGDRHAGARLRARPPLSPMRPRQRRAGPTPRAAAAGGPIAERERVGGHVAEVTAKAPRQRPSLPLGHRPDRLRLGHRDRGQEPAASGAPPPMLAHEQVADGHALRLPGTLEHHARGGGLPVCHLPLQFSPGQADAIGLLQGTHVLRRRRRRRVHWTSPRPALSWRARWRCRLRGPPRARVRGDSPGRRRSRRLRADHPNQVLSVSFSPDPRDACRPSATVVSPIGEGQRSTTLGIRKQRVISRAARLCVIEQDQKKAKRIPEPISGKERRVIRVGVDVGGTFTDLVALEGERVVTAKVPSTPRDQSEGVMHALEAVEAGDVTAFAHGMTVATNALLERRRARTALVTTEGFRDLIELARPDPPALYDLAERRPEPLVPRELRFTVRERMGPEGEIAPLDEDSVREAVERLREAEVEAVAVCLLFAFLHPDHERRVGEAVREALGEVHVSLSSEVLPEFREYERFSTTVADAYLAPTLAAYLERLAGRAEEAGVPAPLVMQSSGGVLDVAAAADQAAGCVLSGPAGGVVGAAHIARASGREDVLTFDMGGTSTDVAPVLGGEASTTTESVVAGVPIKLPMVDVHTVSAGGGSIAWADPGGALRVGPRSAGADPGPAAYGKGGEEPTVTDANVLLGYLGDGTELGGELRIDRGRPERALAGLGDALGLDPLETALGVVRVANAEMGRALRVIS